MAKGGCESPMGQGQVRPGIAHRGSSSGRYRDRRASISPFARARMARKSVPGFCTALKHPILVNNHIFDPPLTCWLSLHDILSQAQGARLGSKPRILIAPPNPSLSFSHHADTFRPSTSGTIADQDPAECLAGRCKTSNTAMARLLLPSKETPHDSPAPMPPLRLRTHL